MVDINIDLGNSQQQIKDLTAEVERLKKGFTETQEAAKKTAEETSKMAKAAEKAAQVSKAASSSIGQMSNSIDDASGAIHSALAAIGMLIPGIGTLATAVAGFLFDVDKRSRTAQFQLTQLRAAFGDLNASVKSQAATYLQLRGAAIDMGMAFQKLMSDAAQFGQFMDQADLLANSAKKLKAFEHVAAGTGMSMDTMAKITEQATRKMGMGIGGTFDLMTKLNGLSKKFGLNINKVAEDIYSAASGLELFGIKARDITPIYEAFMNTLGTDKAGLVGDLTKSFVGGIGKMGESYRAFFSMLGGGAAGGDALGAMFDFEKLLEGGEFAKLGAMIGNSLVETTGAGLMSKQDAINSGQTQAFYMQRKMIEQSFGVGYKEAEAISDVLVKAQTGQITDTEAQASIAELRKTGEKRLSDSMNSLEKMILRFQLSLESVAKSFMSYIQHLVDVFKSAFGTAKAKGAGNITSVWEGTKAAAITFWNEIGPTVVGWANSFLKALSKVGDWFIESVAKKFPMLSIGGKGGTVNRLGGAISGVMTGSGQMEGIARMTTPGASMGERTRGAGQFFARSLPGYSQYKSLVGAKKGWEDVDEKKMSEDFLKFSPLTYTPSSATPTPPGSVPSAAAKLQTPTVTPLPPITDLNITVKSQCIDCGKIAAEKIVQDIMKEAQYGGR